jgi:hypothetical protein
LGRNGIAHLKAARRHAAGAGGQACGLPLRLAPRRVTALRRSKFLAVLAGMMLLPAAACMAQTAGSAVPDMTGRYEFLTPENTLAILQEGATLKGYIDVWQGENASDTIFSYNITIGSRRGDHVEFKTQRIHEKYYRFSGTVERGKGKAPGDADYLQLTGELQTITNNSVTNQKQIERRQVVFKQKSRSAAEQP